MAQTGGLGREPVKALEHELGEIALQLVIVGLCISPLRKFAGVNLLKFRRAIGLIETTVIYNDNITMQNIPLEAYGYVVNGKPALEWVMERQVVKQDKASGIINDTNDYANETVGDPRYPMELFQRVITVSLEPKFRSWSL